MTPERAAQDDGDGEVDDVAPEQELAELLDHALLLPGGSSSLGGDDGSLVGETLPCSGDASSASAYPEVNA
jgi:hypothetical protein